MPVTTECPGRVLLSACIGVHPCDDCQPKTEEIPEQNASGDAVGKAGATGTDAGASSQVNIGTGLTVKDNKKYLALNTNQIDLRNLGQIQTGIELTASRCAYSVYRSLGGII